MSCGNPHQTDCAEVLGRVSDFLDHRLAAGHSIDYADIEHHLQECHPCLEQYGVQVEELQQAVRVVLNRCCGHDHAPDELRLRVIQRIRVRVGGTGSA